MCLSAVYEVNDVDERLVCEYVTAILVKNGSIVLTDLMGEEMEIKGAIESIDLIKNIIKIDTR